MSLKVAPARSSKRPVVGLPDHQPVAEEERKQTVSPRDPGWSLEPGSPRPDPRIPPTPCFVGPSNKRHLTAQAVRVVMLKVLPPLPGSPQGQAGGQKHGSLIPESVFRGGGQGGRRQGSLGISRAPGRLPGEGRLGWAGGQRRRPVARPQRQGAGGLPGRRRSLSQSGACGAEEFWPRLPSREDGNFASPTPGALAGQRRVFA